MIVAGADVTSRLQINPADFKGMRSVMIPVQRLPQMPEWTSDGYTKKTEQYDLANFDYEISVKDIDTAPVVSQLKYIGLHPFEPARFESGSKYLIYSPDEKTVFTPQIAPGESVHFKITHGKYPEEVPRLISVSGNDRSVTSAAYDPESDQVRIRVKAGEAPKLHLKGMSRILLGASKTVLFPKGEQDVEVRLLESEQVLQSMDFAISTDAPLEVSTVVWSSERMVWREEVSAGEPGAPSPNPVHRVLGLPRNGNVIVQKNGEAWIQLKANERGEISFAYSGPFPASFELATLRP
jgi:hypothetical protein